MGTTKFVRKKSESPFFTSNLHGTLPLSKEKITSIDLIILISEKDQFVEHNNGESYNYGAVPVA